jgi:hypothetical protein
MGTSISYPASLDCVCHYYLPHMDIHLFESLANEVNVVEKLLEGMKPSILSRLADPEGKGTFRVLISTPLPESAVAGYLTQLAAKVGPQGVKVGSYPRWGKKRNTVTLVGR